MKLLMCILFCSASVALAQPNRGHERGHQPMMREKNPMEQLDLTKEQQHQVRKLRSDMMKNQIALRAKIQTARIEMMDLFHEEKPDQSRIDSKISDISRLQNELKLNHIAMWFSVNKILTPEQQKIWKEQPMMQERRPMNGRFRPPMMKRDNMDDRSDDSGDQEDEDSEDAGG